MTWQDADELFKLAHFVGCTRPGHHLSGAGLPDDRVSLIEIPALAISSTNCRQRVEAGEPIWYLVPDGIVQYISKRAFTAKRAPIRGAADGRRPRGAFRLLRRRDDTLNCAVPRHALMCDGRSQGCS